MDREGLREAVQMIGWVALISIGGGLVLGLVILLPGLIFIQWLGWSLPAAYVVGIPLELLILAVGWIRVRSRRQAHGG